MELKYYIEFSELIDNPNDIKAVELAKISREIRSHLHKYLRLSGVELANDEIKLEFDLEEIQ